MSTTESATTSARATCKRITHLLAPEKLGLGFDSEGLRVSIHYLRTMVRSLFPSAAFDDSQREKKKQNGGRQEENHRPGIDDPAGKVLHLINQAKAGQRFTRKLRFINDSAGQKVRREENGEAESEADNRGNHLIRSEGRCAATGGDEH